MRDLGLDSFGSREEIVLYNRKQIDFGPKISYKMQRRVGMRWKRFVGLHPDPHPFPGSHPSCASTRGPFCLSFGLNRKDRANYLVERLSFQTWWSLEAGVVGSTSQT